jgi:hypothetical protein
VGDSNDAISIEDDKFVCSYLSLSFKYNINMEDFEIGAIEIDSELIGQDLDSIDPYAEFTDVEDDEYETYILFE